ncbi:hypothetical protein M947_02510 [Sulfurimonas hongkongensis]|uniref:Uncharacterized protein n=1 Tax=Sulfurimonas hongkongensis TaxID=1172190 RepID=T0JQ33_9BACT|nr:hypothetical protein M947_02510 [Sulfurimonas hongkongensis]
MGNIKYKISLNSLELISKSSGKNIEIANEYTMTDSVDGTLVISWVMRDNKIINSKNITSINIELF